MKKTRWIKVNLTFRDRNTRALRTEEAWVEVVTHGGTDDPPELLFQHEGGTHRTLITEDIVKLEIS